MADAAFPELNGDSFPFPMNSAISFLWKVVINAAGCRKRAAECHRSMVEGWVTPSKVQVETSAWEPFRIQKLKKPQDSGENNVLLLGGQVNCCRSCVATHLLSYPIPTYLFQMNLACPTSRATKLTIYCVLQRHV